MHLSAQSACLFVNQLISFYFLFLSLLPQFVDTLRITATFFIFNVYCGNSDIVPSAFDNQMNRCFFLLFFFPFCSGAWITALVCKWSYWQVAGNAQNKRYRDSERWSLTCVIRVYEFYKPWLSDSDIICSLADPRWVWYFGLFSRIPDEGRLQHHIFSDPRAWLCK